MKPNGYYIAIALCLICLLSFGQAISNDGLIGYYDFDETTGNLIDQVDGVNNGANTGVGYEQTGIINESYNYDGSGKSVLTTTGFGTTTQSVSLWVQSTTPNVNEAIYGQGGYNVDNFAIYKKENASAEGIVGICSASASTGINSNILLDNNAWRHVVLTFDGARCRMWVDGVYIGRHVETFTLSTTGARFGESPTGGEGFQGRIDEASIWDRNLSDADISELYNGGAGLPFSDITLPVSFTYTINKPSSQVDFNDISKGYVGGINDWNWLIDSLVVSADQNFSYTTIAYTDLNVCLIINDGLGTYDSICKLFNTGAFYGILAFGFYDETNTPLTGISYLLTPTINGVSIGTLTDNNLDMNLQGITTGTYNFWLTKAGYVEKHFDLTLNQFSDLNYQFAFISNTVNNSVNFQVVDELGAFAPLKPFFAFDNDLNKYNDIQTTDSLGRITFNLNETKSNYSFFSTDFNFGTTVWTINKPKDATTFLDIDGNWEYSITGASYSSGVNIVAGIEKLLLQNTINAYYMDVTDSDGNYVTSSFGLRSTTPEDTKTLSPYLYPLGSAELKIIKLLDYATNLPHAGAVELGLYLYSDSNGIIPLGTYVNDSTGTYNIYMDSNARYQLVIDSQSYNLRPTLDVYYFYLTQDLGLINPSDINDSNVSFTDQNFPEVFGQIRQYAFGCEISEETCTPAISFSLIAIVLLTIVFIGVLQTTPIQQTIITSGLLGLFTVIGFIPLWLFAITIVVTIAWGFFS